LKDIFFLTEVSHTKWPPKVLKSTCELREDGILICMENY